MVYKVKHDELANTYYIETSLYGKSLLFHPLLNKGTAFSLKERHLLSLIGKLPPVVETIDSQVLRVYKQYLRFTDNEQRSIFLHVLFNTNEILFYRLLRENLAKMVSSLYTPTVGLTVKEYSIEFRHPRGLYISYDNKDEVLEILKNRTNPDVDLIVISDGEGVLGIGDQGIGGMGIPVAKLAMYVISGAVSPYKCLPIFLDVGTNNNELLADPMYLGLRHERITGEAYHNFVDKVVTSISDIFPMALLHWEDFSKKTAHTHLENYKEKIACFNDDIQGTGVAALAAIFTALKYKGLSIINQRIVVVGAGTAGLGIANLIHAAMVNAGLSEQEAFDLIWLVDKEGLVTKEDDLSYSNINLFSRSISDYSLWPNRTLATVVSYVKPTILIGCSGVKNLFTKEMIVQLSKDVSYPIILPLSNPSSLVEAKPCDLIDWTNNNVYVATGSPFDKYMYGDKEISIGQCNNIFAFPGIGSGMIASCASRLTYTMLIAASEAIRDYMCSKNYPHETIMPFIDQLPEVTEFVSKAVAEQAFHDNVSRNSLDELNKNLQRNMWFPEYLPYTYNE